MKMKMIKLCKMKTVSKLTPVLTAAMLGTLLSPVTALADPDYVSREENVDCSAFEEEAVGEVVTASHVTEEMCRPGYWHDKNNDFDPDYDRLLMTGDEIRELNARVLAEKDANMHDIINMASEYRADDLRKSLVKSTTTDRTKPLYADGVLISDNQVYYRGLALTISENGYTDETRENTYSVAVRRTDMKSIPTNEYIGYSANDSDNEIVSTVLNVNEPFVIRQRTVVDGNTFYWGYSDNCSGWVDGEDLALCKDKDEWLDAWLVDPTAHDFVVVTCNQIVLDPSNFTPYSSEVKLTFATILKEVPVSQIPEKIGERGSWNNYAVYLPTRDENGKYEKKCALIAQHYDVSEGFVDLTRTNLMKLAFGCLGDRYGWGGMLDAMDCSLFTRNVYKCCGLALPRNTSWQQALPGRKIDISKMTDEEKLRAFSKMPAGTLLYFSGHTMIYTGFDGGLAYVISDTGSLSDSEGEVNVRSMYSVILNPLTTRRRSGNTWIRDLSAAVLPFSEEVVAQVRTAIDSEDPGPGPENETIKRVTPLNGQSFASSSDTLALDTFLGSVRNLYLSFENAKDSAVKELKVTCIKGSKITTKERVKEVVCEKGVAKVKKNRRTGLAALTLKKSGTLTFRMEDGAEYSVLFNVEKPRAVKEYKKIKNTEMMNLDVKKLFNTTIDSGELSIVKDRQKSASVSGNNILVVDGSKKNSIKAVYRYLNKKYSIKITVKGQ